MSVLVQEKGINRSSQRRRAKISFSMAFRKAPVKFAVRGKVRSHSSFRVENLRERLYIHRDLFINVHVHMYWVDYR